MAATKTRITEGDVLEFVQSPGPLKVDRERGIIHRAKMIGTISRNKGEYPLPTLHEARDLYEGAKCNTNHPDRANPAADRDTDDRLGIFRNVTVESDGTYGDLHVLKSHPMAERVFEAAENPELVDAFGFSHNAHTIREQAPDGHVIHKRITRVRSVDLVADPATTKSIFESESPMEPNDPTLGGTQIADPTATNAAEPAAAVEAEPLDQVLDSIQSKYLPKIRAAADKAERKKIAAEMAKKIDDAVKLFADEDQDGASVEADDPQSGPTSECMAARESAVESGKAQPGAAASDWESAADVLESEGVPLTRARIAAVSRTPAADRKALAQSWKGAAAGAPPKPRSGSVMESASHATQTTAAKPAPIGDAKTLARQLVSGR